MNSMSEPHSTSTTFTSVTLSEQHHTHSNQKILRSLHLNAQPDLFISAVLNNIHSRLSKLSISEVSDQVSSGPLKELMNETAERVPKTKCVGIVVAKMRQIFNMPTL